jgi:putative ABC transport system permease protein
MHSIIIDIRDAAKNFSRRPFRSLLSSFGIGIGVTALITMLSISEGAKEQAIAKIRSLGTTTLRIEPRLQSVSVKSSSINLSQGLQLDDGLAIKNWLGSRGTVGVYIKKNGVSLQYGNKSISATVLGVNGGWFGVEKLSQASGRTLTSEDVRNRNNYCVVGSGVAERLELGQAGAGSILLIENFATTVVGSLMQKGRLLTEGTGLSALDFDQTVMLPISSMPFSTTISDRPLVDGIVISLTDDMQDKVLRISRQVEQILLQRHRYVQDFTIVVPYTLLEKVRENQRVFSLIMGSIAGLSLMVGGIGIMNVMLANIAEQTREIGLRMAVGASRPRIVSLFLWNSVLLTLLGSFWGVATGAGMSLIIQHYAGWDVVFSLFSIVAAPVSAVVTGIIFGLHPAIRAAELDPAQALRDS